MSRDFPTKPVEKEDHKAGAEVPAHRVSPISSNPAPSLPRLALSKAEAAESLGCSVDYLEQHVLPDLRVVRRGRRVFIALAELERWLDRSSSRVLG